MVRYNLFRKNLLILYSLAGIGMLGHGLFRPIIPIFARRVGASGFEVGLLTSGFMIARAITSFLVGRHIDKSGERDVYVKVGFFIVFIIAFAYFFVNSYYEILFLRFCQGICSGLMWPVIQIMVVEETEKTHRTRALSLYQITGRGGALLSRLLLAVILFAAVKFGYSELSSFKLVFIIGGVILLIGFIEVAVMPTHKRKGGAEKKKGKPPYPIFFLGFIFGAMLALAPLSFVYLNEHFKISPSGIAFLLLCLDLVTMGAMYGSSHFTDHAGWKKSLWFIIIPCFLSAVFLPFTSSLIGFILFYFIMRLSISSFIPISRAYATNVDTEVGFNIGTLNMVTNLGSVIGPVFAGLVYDNLPGTFRIAGYSLIAIFLIPGLLMLLKKDRKD